MNRIHTEEMLEKLIEFIDKNPENSRRIWDSIPNDGGVQNLISIITLQNN